MKTTLLIKTGNSELLEKDTQGGISLGDVFRTTVLLSSLDGEIIWLTSKLAYPLLAENRKISKLLTWGVDNNLIPYKVDTVINLEKGEGFCTFTSSLMAKNKFGFVKKDKKIEIIGNNSKYIYNLIHSTKLRRKNKKSVQEILYNLIGKKYKGEEYILGYKPKTKVIYDVGLNFHVGSKWPTKGLPLEFWENLSEGLTALNLKVSWQEGMANIYKYIDWLNSNKIIITGDSLGLHIAVTLKKDTIAIFGPTSIYEVGNFKNLVKIKPDLNLNCIPCFSYVCKKKKRCLDSIGIKKIERLVLEILKRG